MSAAKDFSEQTAYEYRIVPVEQEGKPGNIRADLYLTTDPTKDITTFGATLVVDTNYIDLVDKSGNVVTDAYKQDSVIVGKQFPVSAAKIGDYEESFSSVKGLSIASYNAASRQMYLFICGLSINGIQIKQNSLVASFYLKTKSDKVPSSAFRYMKKEEIGTACPSGAVMVAEISSTTEVGAEDNQISVSADASILTDEPTTAAPTTAAPTNTGSTTAAPTTAPATKAIEDMSESELEEEIKHKTQTGKALEVPEDIQKSAAYKEYEEALAEAEKVLDDKDATKEQKQTVLGRLREAESKLIEEYPALAEQMETAPAGNRTIIILICALGAVCAATAAVIIVLIIKKKKGDN